MFFWGCCTDFFLLRSGGFHILETILVGFGLHWKATDLKKQTNTITKDIKNTNQISRDLEHRAMGFLGIFQPIGSDDLPVGLVNSTPQGALIPFACTKIRKSCGGFFLSTLA